MPNLVYGSAEWQEREAAFAPQGSLDRRLERVALRSRVPCDAIVHPRTRRVLGVQVVATREFIDRALFGSMAVAIADHGHMLDLRDAFRAALELESTNAPPGAERQ